MDPSDPVQQASRLSISASKAHCVWISVNKKGSIRAQLNIAGERLGKAEVEEDIKAVSLISKQSEAFRTCSPYILKLPDPDSVFASDSRALVVFAESGTAYIYSLPSLSLILRLPLQFVYNLSPRYCSRPC